MTLLCLRSAVLVLRSLDCENTESRAGAGNCRVEDVEDGAGGSRISGLDVVGPVVAPRRCSLGGEESESDDASNVEGLTAAAGRVTAEPWTPGWLAVDLLPDTRAGLDLVARREAASICWVLCNLVTVAEAPTLGLSVVVEYERPALRWSDIQTA